MVFVFLGEDNGQGNHNGQDDHYSCDDPSNPPLLFRAAFPQRWGGPLGALQRLHEST